MSAFERIDLTQFDGITPGEWSLPHFVDASDGSCMCRFVLSDGYMGSIATVDYSSDDVQPNGDNPPIEEARKNAHAIHSVPRFIAALRAAYAEIDRLTAKLDEWRDAAYKLDALRSEAVEERDRLRQREPSRDEMRAALGDAAETCYDNWTVRRCIDCGVPVAGGPTRCYLCVGRIEGREKAQAEIDRLVAEAVAEPAPFASVLWEVAQERTRQDVKWGEQNHIPIIWYALLGEEVGEAAKEIVEAFFAQGNAEKRDRLMRARQELIQVAAVAVATVQSLDRNELQEVPA